MKNNIEIVMNEISKLKLESDRWRNIKNDLLEFRKLELEKKKRDFDHSKSKLIEDLKNEKKEHEFPINGYYKKYSKVNSEKEIGYLELVLDLHVELLENENETLRNVYEKYKSLIPAEKLSESRNSYGYSGYDNYGNYKDNFNNQISSSLEGLLSLKSEIIELEKTIKDERFFPCEEISSIEKIKEELDKFLLFEKELKDLKEMNSDLEFELEKIEKELNLERKKLELERNTNLEMLKKLEILNEDKLKANLAIKDNIIKNLEEKFIQLETKYSELIIKEN